MNVYASFACDELRLTTKLAPPLGAPCPPAPAGGTATWKLPELVNCEPLSTAAVDRGRDRRGEVGQEALRRPGLDVGRGVGAHHVGTLARLRGGRELLPVLVEGNRRHVDLDVRVARLELGDEVFQRHGLLVVHGLP